MRDILSNFQERREAQSGSHSRLQAAKAAGSFALHLNGNVEILDSGASLVRVLAGIVF